MWSIPVLDRLLMPQKESLQVVRLGHFNFEHEGPMLDSWILPLVTLFDYMFEPKRAGRYRWGVDPESSYKDYMERFSLHGVYLGPRQAEPAGCEDLSSLVD